MRLLRRKRRKKAIRRPNQSSLRQLRFVELFADAQFRDTQNRGRRSTLSPISFRSQVWIAFQRCLTASRVFIDSIAAAARDLLTVVNVPGVPDESCEPGSGFPQIDRQA